MLRVLRDRQDGMTTTRRMLLFKTKVKVSQVNAERAERKVNMLKASVSSICSADPHRWEVIQFIIREETFKRIKKSTLSTFCFQTPNVSTVIWFYHQFSNLTAVCKTLNFTSKWKHIFKHLLNSFHSLRLFLVSLAIPIISEPLGCCSVWTSNAPISLIAVLRPTKQHEEHGEQCKSRWDTFRTALSLSFGLSSSLNAKSD